MTRRRFVGLLLAGATLGTGTTLGYATAIEPDSPTLERVPVEAPFPVGLRIGLISDLHISGDHTLVGQRSLARLGRAVEFLRREQPDVITVLGDYTNIRHAPDRRSHRAQLEAALAGLRALDAPLGVYAILGNHDIHPDLRGIAHLPEWGHVQLLRNDGVVLSVRGESFGLAGLADAVRERPDFTVARRTLPRGIPVLTLVHEPDVALDLPDTALVLSGHSHGGQIRLPLVGPLYLPKLSRRFPWGLRQAGPATLVYTSLGLGTVPPSMRFNCPPEVAVLEIVGAGGRNPLPPATVVLEPVWPYH